MKTFFALAAIVVATGCVKADKAVPVTDTRVTMPASGASAPNVTDTTAHATADSTVNPANSCGVSGKPVLSDDGVGELKVGRTVADIRSKCQVESDAHERGSEGMMERVLAVRIGGEIVRALVNDDRISRVEVNHALYRTPDSLGVDTPLRKIARSRGARFFPGEDGVYGFVADHCGLSFRFSVPLRPPKGRDWTAASIDSAHGDAAVDRVLVTKCQR